MLKSYIVCKGQYLYRYLKGRQGTNTKRANGNFLCRVQKIVIGRFNHPSRIQQNLAGHVSPLSSTAAFYCFLPILHSVAICGNLGQFAYTDYLIIVYIYQAPVIFKEEVYYYLYANTIQGRSQCSQENAKYYLIELIITQGFTVHIVTLFYTVM